MPTKLPTLYGKGNKKKTFSDDFERYVILNFLFYGKNPGEIEDQFYNDNSAYNGSLATKVLTYYCLSVNGDDASNAGIFKNKDVDEIVSELLKQEDSRYVRIGNLLLNDSDSSVNSSTSESILDEIKRRYDSKDFNYVNVEPIYESFKEKYGKTALVNTQGRDLLYLLFSRKDQNHNSLIFNLEHNNLYKYFGGIGGGSAYKYHLFCQKEDNTWTFGTAPSNAKKITEDEAIAIAEEYRNRFVKSIEIIESSLPLLKIEDYTKMDNQLKSSLGDLYFKTWVQKYFQMLFPEVFVCFYNLDYLSNVYNILHMDHGNSVLELHGGLSIVAKELDIPNVYFSNIIMDYTPINDEEANENDELIDDINEMDSIPPREPRKNQINNLNTILYGAPGTGKTFSMPVYAIAALENKSIKEIQDYYRGKRNELMIKFSDYLDNGRIVFTTFHQNYGYEDFIEGLRAKENSENLIFKNVSGIFKKVSDIARSKDENYVILIDEINRGNISKIFGELITLIEENKRWGEEEQIIATLPSGSKFVVPNNLYIVGTMNSSDKSISLIDAALRRRFNFVEFYPDETLISDPTLKKVFNNLNECLYSDLNSTDLLIGHSYFVNKTKKDLVSIINNNIIPLLYEYYNDRSNKVESTLKTVFKDTTYIVNNNQYRRIEISE